MSVLEVKSLKTQFNTSSGTVNAVDGVSFHVNEHEIVGIVGESGCGKSVTQLSVTQLVASPPGKILGGEVLFEGKNLLDYAANSPEMRDVRGGKISMIFQEPMTSLNPSMTVNNQLSEIMRLHMGLNKKQARARAIELLKMVGIPAPESRVDDYPHQMSGGMRQRVMIAMGLACNPKLIIADEPTTALDVTTQAVLLELMKDMVDQFNTSLIIVTHNLGIVARYAHRIYVMYAGRVIETGTTKEIFSNPKHPYTRGLMRCIPRLDDQSGKRLHPIQGMPPNLIDMPETCAFYPRCEYRCDECLQQAMPRLTDERGKHEAACFRKLEEMEYGSSET